MKLGTLLRFSPHLQLTAFLLCVTAALWSLISFDLHRTYTQAFQTSTTQIQNLSRAFAEEVSASVNFIDLSLVDLRDSWIGSRHDFAEAVKKRQSRLAENVGFQVAVIAPDGMLEFSSADPKAKAVSLADREHFQVHQKGQVDRLHISKPVFGRVTKRWSIQFTRPIFNTDGSFGGVIVLSVAPQYFSRFFDTINLGTDGAIALIRTTGDILARSPNPERAIGKNIGQPADFRNPHTHQGVYRLVSAVDNVERNFAWRALSKGQLAVTVGQSVEMILSPYYKQRQIYILAGCGLTFLLAVIGYSMLSNLKERTLHEAALEENEVAMKESIAKLQEEQTRIKVIIDNSHDAFVGIDAQGIITDWNRKAETTFGWPAQEAIGRSLNDLIVPQEQRAAHAAGHARYVNSGKGTLIDTVLEIETLHRSGRRIPVELALAGYHNGKEYVSNAFIRDITERKEAKRLDDERVQSLEESRRALQQAQKLEALGRLTGGIAHDFNNVLQTLATGIDVVLFSSKDDKIKSMLQASKRAVQRGVELTRQLSVFGRAQEAHLKTVDLGEQIDGMIPLLRGALPSNIELDIKVTPGSWLVDVDPLQFELAVLNLAMNARDAMPGGGVFTVEASNENRSTTINDLVPSDYVHIRISDTGEGMDPEVLAKALDPFFTTKAVGKGSGIGLSQVYGFTKQMGGAVSLRSEKGRGLQVSIYLPRSYKEATPTENNSKEIVKPAGAGARILLVEDDALVRETVEPALRAHGFQVTVAESGDAALQMLESGYQVDIVFSDVVMPGQVGGMELAEIIQKRYSHLKIVLATGYSERRLAVPNVQIIGKPYQITNLAETLTRTMGNA